MKSPSFARRRSTHFVTDSERMEAVLEDPEQEGSPGQVRRRQESYLLLVNSKISAVRDLLPILEKVMQSGRPLVIIA